MTIKCYDELNDLEKKGLRAELLKDGYHFAQSTRFDKDSAKNNKYVASRETVHKGIFGFDVETMSVDVEEKE